ncbi:MAG: RlmE family RNA methyltransferase [Deltaproteobacteria bacterium]|nr:RlmE family RNA methyltransferase [Deltaproteobacteria bacterium]
MPRMDDKRVRRDHFHQRAQKAGFRSRAVFKLEEIDHALRIFAPGDRVLDLGCAPGSWLQYASGVVGEHGRLVGIDRLPLKAGLPNTKVVIGDVFNITATELRGDLAAFDVVMSDMAPDTTGIRHVDQARSEGLFERALEIAGEALAPGGNFVGKLFQGPDWQRIIAECRRRFAQVKTVKPESSRSFSIEQYVVGRGFKG